MVQTRHKMAPASTNKRISTTYAPAKRQLPRNSRAGSQHRRHRAAGRQYAYRDTPDSETNIPAPPCDDSSQGTTLHAGRRHAAHQLPWSAGMIGPTRQRWSSLAGPTPLGRGNQPRKSMPVWARPECPGGSAINASVFHSSSSGSAIILIAGALQTSAPWRRSNAHSSSARRADVTRDLVAGQWRQCAWGI